MHIVMENRMTWWFSYVFLKRLFFYVNEKKRDWINLPSSLLHGWLVGGHSPKKDSARNFGKKSTILIKLVNIVNFASVFVIKARVINHPVFRSRNQQSKHSPYLLTIPLPTPYRAYHVTFPRPFNFFFAPLTFFPPVILYVLTDALLLSKRKAGPFLD